MKLPGDWREEPLFPASGDSIFSGQMPITLQDLGAEEGTEVTELVDTQNSFLLDRAVYRQDAWYRDQEDLTLRYVVLRVKWDFLMDICLEDYLHMYEFEKMSETFRQQFCGQFLPSDAAPWGADRAWQLERNGEMETEYLLLFHNRIVNFQSFRELTGEEMAEIGSLLGYEQKSENSKNK